MIYAPKNRSYDFSFMNIPGGQCFLDGQRPLRDGTQYIDANPMNLWEDLSGNENDVQIATAEAMPLYKSDAINGQGGANTVGRDNYMDFISSPLSVITSTIYIIAYFPSEINTNTSPQYIIGQNDTTSSPRATFVFGGYTGALSNEVITIEGRNSAGNQRAYCIKSNIPAGNHILTFSRNATDAEILLDGSSGTSQIASGTPNTVNVSNFNFERILRATNVPARAFQGYVCGMYIYSRYFSEESSEHLYLMNYFSNRFGIPLV